VKTKSHNHWLSAFAFACTLGISIPALGQQLLLQTGFEQNSQVVPKDDATLKMGITGIDYSVPAPNNWASPHFKFWLYGMTWDKGRYAAQIVPEPGKPSNNILKFYLTQPSSDRIRMQGDFQFPIGTRELSYSVRVFIPENMNALKNYPGPINWFTIGEYWSGPQNVADDVCSRVTIGIGKSTASPTNDLYFHAYMKNYTKTGSANTVWGSTSDLNWAGPPTAVPIGKWFTLEVYLKEGNQTTGKFYAAMTPDGGAKKVLFDVTNFTHNTAEANPNGIDGWVSFMKLYTSDEIGTYMQKHGYLQMYWDDLKVWFGKLPGPSMLAAPSDLRVVLPR
jgi:hypothetical protein